MAHRWGESGLQDGLHMALFFFFFLILELVVNMLPKLQISSFSCNVEDLGRQAAFLQSTDVCLPVPPGPAWKLY